MTDKPLSISRINQLELLAAGLCSLCKSIRTAIEGHTRDRCAKCAELDRIEKRNKYRKQKGLDISAPVRHYHLRSKESHALPIEQNIVPTKQPKIENTTKADKGRPVARGTREGETSISNEGATRAPKKRLRFMQGHRMASHSDTTPAAPKHYGSLSIEDIAIATSTLPLKPPGKA